MDRITKVGSLFVLTIVCHCMGTNGQDGRREFDVTYCELDQCDFNQLAVDQMRNGYVYVGARNKLFQLNADLTLSKAVVTGPSSDQKDAVNKILLIDKINRRIVVCNSNNHGLCELRKAGDIERLLTRMNINATAVKQYVAASADLSTVGFLASANGQQYLFVGSSNMYTDDFGAACTVSQRMLYANSLDSNMFSVTLFEDGIYVGDMCLNRNKDDLSSDFQVTFIDGFELEQTAYFVLHYPDAYNNQQMKSFVAQICTGDPSTLLKSYLEQEVVCTVNGRKYTKAIASVTRRVGAELATSLNIPSTQSDAVMFISFEDPSYQGGSAVCLYPWYEINSKYVSMLERCMRDQKNPPSKIAWVKKEDVPCGQGRYTVQSPACANKGIFDVAQFLQGTAFTQEAVFVSDRLITALEVTTTLDHTIALLGNSNGMVTKLRLNSRLRDDSSNSAYESIVVDNKVPIQSIQLAYNDPSLSNIPMVYVMTTENLVALPLYSCSKYDDCSSCLGSGDPFCGWCPLETRCAPTSSCRSSIQHARNCPRLTSASGELKMSIKVSEKTIVLRAYNLPVEHSSEYECSFNDLPSASTSATNNPDGSITVQCITPPQSSLPPLWDAGSRNVPLSLVYQQRQLTSTNLVYYNCSYHSMCMACVDSGFNCRWCIYENRCVETISECKQLSDTAQRPAQCPQVSAFYDSNQPTYYLSSGQKSTLQLRGTQLPKSSKQAKYQCSVKVPNVEEQLVDALRASSGEVHCRGVEGIVAQDRRSSNATLTVMWNKTTIDATVPLTVVMFKCALDVEDNCGTCLQSPVEWRCGWCEARSSCVYRTDPCGGTWLQAQADQVCRNPHIDSFWPTTANPGGTTRVTLTGTNFDSGRNMKVTVAGYNCTLVHSNCCKASCHVKGTRLGSGNISLCITDRYGRCRNEQYYHTTSTQHFNFVQSKLDLLSPKDVLCGWGTPVTINGSNLDAGNNVTVTIDGQDCVVQRRTSTLIECKLPCTCSSSGRRRRHSRRHAHRRRTARHLRRQKRAEVNAWLSFDGQQKVPTRNSAVHFHTNVRINSIQPLKTFYSGGVPLRVTGTNLRLIHDPHIKVVWEERDYTSKCRLMSSANAGKSDTLECTSPHIADRRIHLKSGGFPDAVYVESVGCHETLWTGPHLQYVQDPALEQFDVPEQTKTYRNEPIYIFGTNLCPEAGDCIESIVSVMVGEVHCNVTRYVMDQIECQPPEASPGIYPVVVRIGGYQSQVGSLQYEETSSVVLLIVLIVGCLVVVGTIVGVAVACRYRRRLHASDQEVKNMQVQMSVMESKVAKVCKEAFAELQTDMSELDNVGGGVGIPYLDYPEYLLRVLFPDAMLAGHQNLLLPRHLERSDSRTSNRQMQRGPHESPMMAQFNQLLENKCFMLCFIRSIERQNTFTMKDKANVAGLILVILQNRLVYATEILEQLLSELVDKNMESHQHPKLLFRRTESVAEKMLTHWFSILLHGFVVECAGEPLFMLYRAIKQQVDKGPVDMFTSEARYSLSEDKLLRQSVDHEVIILRVNNYMSDHQQFEFSVKVLSCDSVSQVKRKVLDVAYMHTHYSQRPPPESVDLEWKRPEGSFTLRDEDTTNEITDDGKVVNTLAHYSVPDGALVVVVPRQGSSLLNYSAMSTNSKASGHRHNGSGSRLFQMEGSNTSLPRYKQTSRSGTPTLPTEKLYHLVKHNDQDQREGDRGNKMVSEIYLTRLLTTKGTIQKFVDDLFETIFSVTQRGHALPPAIKHMFDFLDHQADIHDITDPDIVHTWKSNCLPLRFWVNMIKNPEFVFDVHKSAIVDCYLSVIAQAFMDSCSTAAYKYGKDSPSNKLLYAKDIPNYRHWVKSYYQDISELPRTNPKNMAAFLNQESYTHANKFNTNAALQQLFSYVQKYSDKIAEALEREPEARRQNLLQRLEQTCLLSNGGS